MPAGEDDTSGDPLFTSTTDGAEDFTPLAGSPLIDAGATSSGKHLSTEIGVSDIGAVNARWVAARGNMHGGMTQ